MIAWLILFYLISTSVLKVDRKFNKIVFNHSWKKSMNLNEQLSLHYHKLKVCPVKVINMWQTSTLKRLTPLCVFYINVFSRERVNSGFLWLLILLEATSFLKISLKFLKLSRRYEDFFLQYWLFSMIFRIFWLFLVAKKLVTSAYNKWCLLTFNLL